MPYLTGNCDSKQSFRQGRKKLLQDRFINFQGDNMVRENKLGSVVFQTQEAMKELIQFGESKHLAKESFKSNYSGSQAIDKFMHSFGKSDGIHSYATLKSYLQESIRLAKFVKETYGVKDISKITAEQVKDFFNQRTAGLAKASLSMYKSALEKFESALSLKYNQKYDFKLSETVKELRAGTVFKTKERAGYYGYTNPAALLKSIDENKTIPESHKIAIAIALESGSRLHKTLTVSGVKIDKLGNFYTVGKGGRLERFESFNSLSKETADRLQSYLKDTGKKTLKVSNRDYKNILSELDKAAAATGQNYEAGHGLKKDFAADVRAKLIEQGMSYNQAVNSKEYQNALAHNRHLNAY